MAAFIWILIIFGISPALAEANISMIPHQLPEYMDLTISNGEKNLMIFHSDGRIEVTSDATVDETAKQVIDAMGIYLSSFCKSVK